MHRQHVSADTPQMPCSTCCRHSTPSCRLQAVGPASFRARQPVQPHNQWRRHVLAGLRCDPACCTLLCSVCYASNVSDAMVFIMLRLRAGSTRCAWRGAAAQPQQPMSWSPGSLEAAGAAATAAATASRQHRRHQPQPAQQRELFTATCHASQIARCTGATSVLIYKFTDVMQENTGAD
jgi:hypothetical protein